MTTRVRPPILRLGPAELDLAEGRVRHPDESIALTSLEVHLLCYLAERPSREVSRAELLANVWGYASKARTRTVDALVHRLRDKLREPRGRPRHLLTVAGGYRLVPSPPRGREVLCAELQQALVPTAIVTLVGPEGAGKSEVARYLAYQLEGFWLQLDAPEPGELRSALMLAGLAGPEDLGDAGEGGLWVLDGVGPLDVQERAWLQSVAQGGSVLLTARRPLGLPHEHPVRIAPLERPPAEPQRAEPAPRPSDRLTAEQRAVLEVAAHFRGAFLASALDAVLGRALGAQLEILLSQGLLVRHGPEHLVLPGPVRVLLADRPLEGDSAERYRRFFAQRARADYWEPHRLRPELEDLQAAFEASVRCGASEEVVALTLAIQRVQTLTWNYPTQRWFGERALAVVDHPRLWVAAAHWERARSHPSEAWRCAERASALAITPWERAEVDLLFGILEMWRSRSTEALERFDRAEQAFAELGDGPLRAVALYHRAVTRSMLDDVASTERDMESALACVPSPPLYLRNNLDLVSANLLRWRGLEEQAAAILQELLARSEAHGDSTFVLDAEVALADVLLCLGRLEEASRIIQEAMLRASRCGNLLDPMRLLWDLAELHLATGQPALAVLAARDARVYWRHVQHRGIRLSGTGLLGLALLLAGEREEAIVMLQAAARAPGDDGARHTATLAVARARAGDPSCAELLREAQRQAVLPSTRRWVAWCEAALQPGSPAPEPGPSSHDRIGRALVDLR
jgi:DNA-binding winged helix-turn-helix (wHTH) protein/tetratricopeptide (TPR) repeat protein